MVTKKPQSVTKYTVQYGYKYHLTRVTIYLYRVIALVAVIF
jgi:hypothetical protein